MIRIIIGAIAGFLVWTILLKSSDFLFTSISPDWWAKNQNDLMNAINNKTEYPVDYAILFILILRSAILTVISGYVTVWIAKENFKSTIILAILLLAVGLLVHSIIWNYVPFWYHLGILLPLIPLAIFGGKLKSVEEVHNF